MLRGWAEVRPWVDLPRSAPALPCDLSMRGVSLVSFFLFFFFFLRCYLFIERGEGWEERERNVVREKYQSTTDYTCPDQALDP